MDLDFVPSRLDFLQLGLGFTSAQFGIPSARLGIRSGRARRADPGAAFRSRRERGDSLRTASGPRRSSGLELPRNVTPKLG
jgi:hypothetical protein